MSALLTPASLAPAPTLPAPSAPLQSITETVLMADLRSGDIVRTHGVRVRLTSPYATHDADVIGWRSEYVGCVDPTQTPESLHGGFGRWFREGWAVQGRATLACVRELALSNGEGRRC